MSRKSNLASLPISNGVVYTIEQLPPELGLDAKKGQTQALALLIKTMKYKDPYTFYHSKRVASFCLATAIQLQVSHEDLLKITIAGLFHDIGKMGVPDRVLKKPGRLTMDEFIVMKEHSELSCSILYNIPDMAEIISIVRHHHERMDGYGYPAGLKGEHIPLGSRIILVADTFDAMTSNRPYRRGLDNTVSFEELRQCSGSQFDEGVVDAFLKSMVAMSEKEWQAIEDYITLLTGV